MGGSMLISEILVNIFIKKFVTLLEGMVQLTLSSFLKYFNPPVTSSRRQNISSVVVHLILKTLFSLKEPDTNNLYIVFSYGMMSTNWFF